MLNNLHLYYIFYIDGYSINNLLSIDNNLIIKNDMVCTVYVDGEISKMKISDIEKRDCFIGIVE